VATQGTITWANARLCRIRASWRPNGDAIRHQ
jgi:hypothetical protein